MIYGVTIRKLFVITFAALCIVQGAACDADTVAVMAVHKDFNRRLTGAGAGLVINASMTELFKHSIHKMRPDMSDNGSFPSRHTSYAFCIGSIAAHELYDKSPFWVTAAHVAADAVAMQRVLAERHYPCDALAGAAIGLVSAEAGYAVSRLIFGGGSHAILSEEDNVTPSLMAETTALIPLRGRRAGLSAGCGIESSLRVALPVSDRWGLGADLLLRSQPVYKDCDYAAPLNGAGVRIGCFACVPAGRRWSVEGRVSAGLIKYVDRPFGVVPSMSYLADLSCAAYRNVARCTSVGMRIGCDMSDTSPGHLALIAAFVTKAEF